MARGRRRERTIEVSSVGLPAGRVAGTAPSRGVWPRAARARRDAAGTILASGAILSIDVHKVPGVDHC